MFSSDGSPFKFTSHQVDYWRNCNKLYNIKGGAAGSGKTWLDLRVIPERIINNTDGDIVIMGATRGTLERNIIRPMQELYGGLVTNISSNNESIMFGKRVYVLGAEKRTMVTKIQGMNIGYAYGDEVTTWSETVWNMLSSRLRLKNSIMDGTCNPDDPNHWFKKFIDISEETGDLYYQHYHIDDGALDEEIRNRMKRTLTGVTYRRLVLGEWARADGLIYNKFAQNPEKHFIKSDEIDDIMQITIGVDWGGNASKHAFVATGISSGYDKLYVLASKLIDTEADSKRLSEEFILFLREVESQFRQPVQYVYVDTSMKTLRLSFESELRANGLSRVVRNSRKNKIMDRVGVTESLIAENRLFYTENASTLKRALEGATWDSKKASASGETKRYEDIHIDTLDAFEYSFENDMNRIIDYSSLYKGG